MAAVLNTLKNVIQSAYIFMGSVDSGSLPQNFEQVDTNCNTPDNMVQLIECQNTETTSINGIYQISGSLINDVQKNVKDVTVDQTVPTNEIDGNDNTQNKKRKLEDAVEMGIKRAKNSEMSMEDLENTGRGKRIKKIKKNFFYDDFRDSDQIKDFPLKKSDRRFTGDIEDKEYVPPFKLSKSENGVSVASVAMTLPLTQKDSSSSGYDYLRSLIKPDLKKKTEMPQQTTAQNEEEEIEDLTIIDITNISSDDEDDGASSVGDQSHLSKNHDSVPLLNNEANTIEKQQMSDILPEVIHTCNSPNLSSIQVPQRPSSAVTESKPMLPCLNTVNSPSNSQQISHPVNTHLNSISQVIVDEVKNHSGTLEEMEKNPVTSSKPQKKVSKKSSKKPQKKSNRSDFVFDDMELKHINKLKSLTNKKHEKPSDNCKQMIGPYIQCKGPKDSLSLCRIVNVKDQDTEHGALNPAKYSMLPSESCCSHMSSRMNEKVPWKCILCPFGSSYMDLGDLFGPYFPQQPPQTPISTNDELNNSLNDLSKHSSLPEKSPNVLSNGLPSELWVHCDCAVWTSGIFVSGGKLRGLEEAALAAQQYTCFSCNQKGATLGCLIKGCQQNYHYICACRAGCTFQAENFSILCPKHKNYRINKLLSYVEPVNGQLVS